MPEEEPKAEVIIAEQKKRNTILVYIEHGMVWPDIKVADHDPIDVIVVNNDKTAIWRPRVIYNCDEEIESIIELADQLQNNIDYIEKVVKGDK